MQRRVQWDADAVANCDDGGAQRALAVAVAVAAWCACARRMVHSVLLCWA